MNTNRKTFLLVGVIGLMVIGLAAYLLVARPYLNNRTVETTETAVINRPDLNFQFSFPSGPGGFALVERFGEAPAPTPTGTSTAATSTGSTTVPAPAVATGTAATSTSALRHMYVLMETEAYEDIQAGEIPGELPPTISVLVYDGSAIPVEGSREERLKAWARSQTALTQYSDTATGLESIELDGATAIRYQADGLYLTNYTLVFHRDHIYLFAGQQSDPASRVATGYQDVLNSVLFF